MAPDELQPEDFLTMIDEAEDALPLPEDEFKEEEFYDFLNDLALQQDEAGFYQNLAEFMDDSVLKTLGSHLTDLIEEDDRSRQEWLNYCLLIMKYLGTKIEDGKLPFDGAANTFDVTMLNALVQFYSNAKTELFPLVGPCVAETLGLHTDEKEDAAERLKIYFNTYLTKIDKIYDADSEKLLLYAGLLGTCFRKVYIDPVTSLPVARTVIAQDLIVNNDCSSLLQAERITHVFYLTKKDLLLRIRNGFYKNIPLKKIRVDQDFTESQEKFRESVASREGISRNDNTKEDDISRTYKVYECHVELSDSDFYESAINNDDNSDIPKPYIVTILEDKQILSIRRNYDIADDSFKRIECFVQYRYMPGFGLYGFGIGHLLANNAITLTNVNRQILNAESMKIFPRGVRAENIGFAKNNMNIAPSEFVEITGMGSRSLQEVFQFLQYPPQSDLLINFLRDMREQTAHLAASGMLQIPENSTNVPVGTTLALLEVQNKPTTVTITSLRKSLGDEIQLLYKLFSQGFNEIYEFNIPGGSIAISPDDFRNDITICPSSNPEVSTFTQSLMKAEAVLKMAQSQPDMHNLREAFKNMYKIMKVDHIDEILPPPPPPPPPPIDPNEVLMRDVQIKEDKNKADHMKNMKSLELDLAKERRLYVEAWQKLILAYQEKGLEPPSMPDIPNLTDDGYMEEPSSPIPVEQKQDKMDSQYLQQEQDNIDYMNNHSEENLDGNNALQQDDQY